jgi:hypothetical protein
MQIATRTRCQKDPAPALLLKHLVQLINMSKAKMEYVENKGEGESGERDKAIDNILTLFQGVFLYMSTRTSDFDKNHVAVLSKTAFIPRKVRGQLIFYLPSQIFFQKEQSENDQDSLAEALFQEVEYNSFLALAGVKSEPALQELFELMITKPDEVLDCLGEPKYKALLRRCAANPPFKHVTKEMRSSAWLLGYLVMDEELTSDDGKDTPAGQSAQFVLSRAEDIYIVDNSFLRRQFSMFVSPMEQQLEEFYNMLGSQYVSQVVTKSFEVKGRQNKDTDLARQFASRISERRPLLISPSISSRPLSPNASKVLDEKYLEVVQVDDIQAKYSFQRSSKHVKVTSCARAASRQSTTIFITSNFDWFDVGTAIGGLILKRCQLEDAFFLSSILEAPLDTLRSRGFPVDRVLKPVAPPPPPPPQPVAMVTKPHEMRANGNTARAATGNMEGFPAASVKSQSKQKPKDSALSIMKSTSGGMLGKVLGGFRHGNDGGGSIVKSPLHEKLRKRVVHTHLNRTPRAGNSNTPSSPENDAHLHNSLGKKLLLSNLCNNSCRANIHVTSFVFIQRICFIGTFNRLGRLTQPEYVLQRHC